MTNITDLFKEFDSKFNWEEIFGKNSNAQKELKAFLLHALEVFARETRVEEVDIVEFKVKKDFSYAGGWNNSVKAMKDLIEQKQKEFLKI